MPYKSRKPKSKPLQPKSKRHKSRKPKSRKPKSRKPKSKRHKSRKPKSRKPKSKRHKSRKPKSRKPKSRKPKSRKPKSKRHKSRKHKKKRKYKINEICHDIFKTYPTDERPLNWTFGPGELIHFTTNLENGRRIKQDGFVKTASITGAEGLGGNRNTTWWLPYGDVNNFAENPDYGVSESNIFEDMNEEYGIDDDDEIQYEKNLIRFQENAERVFDNEDHLNNTMFFTNTVNVSAVIEPNPYGSLRVEICTQTSEIPVVDVTDFILQHIDHDNVILHNDDDDENSMDDDDENSMQYDDDEDSEYW